MTALSAEKIVDVFRNFAKIAVPCKANIFRSSGDLMNVMVERTQRDLENFTTTKFLTSYTVEAKSLKTSIRGPPIDMSTELLSSQWQNYRAVLRKIILKNGNEKQMLEIWKGCSKAINIDIEAQELHGKIYEDEQFGCLKWSHDGKHLLYVTEKRQPKTESFFKTDNYVSNNGDSNSKTATKSPVKGDEFLYREDWGEKFIGKCQPILSVLDVEKNSIDLVKGLPEDISFGQALWTPDDKGLICVGWVQEPRRLGISVCSNRKSALYYFNLETGSYEILSKENKSIHSPRLSLDGKKLVYLENAVDGPHHKGSRLIMMSWPEKSSETIINLVNESAGDKFPGLYLFSFPKNIWLSDNRRIVFHCCWRSRIALVCVDTETKEVVRIDKDYTVGLWTSLALIDDILLVACSSPNIRDHLRIGKLPKDVKTESIQWHNLDDDEKFTVPGIEWKIHSFMPSQQHVNKKYPNLDVEVILLKPNTSKDVTPPLIVFPHGGPHVAHCASFKHTAAAFTNLGFAIAFVNYRGSAGFGENYLNSLLGNIGTQDVIDCKAAVDYVIEKEGFDQKKLVIYGGSHGGFLVMHMIGQYPDLFQAAVCINGVVDLPSKVSISDIPDWGWIESGLKYSPQCIANPDAYATFWEKSPTRYLDQMKTPSLILMGKLDLRVPPSQSLIFYHAFKARGIPVRMNVYEEGHGLLKPEVEADAFVHAVLWFDKYLNQA